MTHSQIIAAARQGIDRDDKDEVLVDGITLALEKVGGLFPILESKEVATDISIVADDGSCELPTYTLRLHEARLIDGTSSYDLLIKPPEWIKERYPNPSGDATSKPVYCYQEGTTLHFVPYSNGSYSVRATISRLIGTDEEAQAVSSAVVALAVAHAHMILEHWESARHWDRKAAEELVLCGRMVRNREPGKIHAAEPWLRKPYASDYWDDPFQKENPR
jgi:hypothetical protein